MPVAKPSAVADWATTASGSDITPPTGGQQAAGWTVGQFPPHNWFNWWQNLAGQWTDYLNDLENQTLTWATAQTFSLGLDAGSHKITSVLDPTSAQDAATKAYVDRALLSHTSTSCASFSTVSTSFVDITNLTTGAVTTRGGVILLTLQPDGTTSAGGAFLNNNDTAKFQLMFDGARVAVWEFSETAAGGTTNPLSLSFLSLGVAAGSHTWKLQALSVGGATLSVLNLVLVVTEI